MPDASPPRVQFVISARFIVLLLVAAGLLAGGYYWYSQQQETQKRLRTPPYFINRGPAVFRLCQHCLGLDKLKPKTEWDVGAPAEIPATEQRWFLAVEDPPLPVEVAGVLMLPVYPAQGDNPALGFDRTRVWLVLFQSLQRMPELTQLPPPPAPPQPSPPSPPPVSIPAQPPYLGDWKNEDPETRGVTRFSIAADEGKLVVHAWGKCFPTDCDWKEADATATENSLSVDWNLSSGVRHWELSLESDGRLKLIGDRDETAYFIRSTEGQR